MLSDPNLADSQLRQRAIQHHWLFDNDPLLAPRLTFPLAIDPSEVVHDLNRAIRNQMVEDMLGGAAEPVRCRSYLGDEPEATLGEVDRYGIPFRTVLGLNTGLLRADPYYLESFLEQLWSRWYRLLYGGRHLSHATFLADQIRRGQAVLERVQSRLRPGMNVADIGCGMGGMLLPFKFFGCDVVGCDYGIEYVDRGKSVGIDLRIGGPEAVADRAPFDLILLSHVVQHVPDPVQLLQQAASLLKRSGIAYVEVPGLLNLRQWYKGDLLQYLQNANRWHFTAGTLSATLARAGLQAIEINETVSCVCVVAPTHERAVARDGPRVLNEIQELERAFQGR